MHHEQTRRVYAISNWRASMKPHVERPAARIVAPAQERRTLRLLGADRTKNGASFGTTSEDKTRSRGRDDLFYRARPSRCPNIGFGKKYRIPRQRHDQRYNEVSLRSFLSELDLQRRRMRGSPFLEQFNLNEVETAEVKPGDIPGTGRKRRCSTYPTSYRRKQWQPTCRLRLLTRAGI